MTVNNPFTWGLGRRKSSVARVRIKSGAGAFQVNGKAVNEYFTTLRDINAAAQHQMVSERAYENYGQFTLGFPGANPMG